MFIALAGFDFRWGGGREQNEGGRLMGGGNQAPLLVAWMHTGEEHYSAYVLGLGVQYQ